MAKKTDTKSKAAKTAAKKPAKKAAPKKAPKAPKAPKAETEAAKLPRHPKARLAAQHGGKQALAKSLAESLAREDEDTDIIANRLETASNSQLLRLQSVVETVKEKYGSRDKLIAAIGTAENKAKDKDYLAMLDRLPLPHLLDLAQSHARRAAS